MRVRVPRAGLTAGLMCAQVLAQPAPAEPPAPVFEVRGRIVAASSGQTLPRARVGGWYLESAVINGRDAIDAPFDFGSRYAYYGARIVIATTGATISGIVTGDGSTPLSDYTVAVFPTDRSKWFAHSRFLAFARPSHDDTFVVAGLPPAEYFLAAVERLDATAGGGEWQDPAVLDTLAGDATRVTVRDGDALNLTLRLVRR